MMKKLQVVSHFADRGTAGIPVAPDGQEQLVLGRGQSGGPGPLLAPAFEVS
jgi:hypothetical protein